MNNLEDSERAWLKIEQEINDKKKSLNTTKWDNPLQEKYYELNEKYRTNFGKNTGSYECELLLDDLRAFERVFHIMGWNKKPN